MGVCPAFRAPPYVGGAYGVGVRTWGAGYVALQHGGILGCGVMKLSELKIIISGGAQGMGRHFAVRLVEAGAQVAIGDVNEKGLAETVELGHSAAGASAGKIHARALNVADEADVGAFVEWAHKEMGGLNGVISNAGILRDGLLVKKDRETGAIKKMTKEQWDAVIAVNLTGATFFVRDAVAKMVETGAAAGGADKACRGVVVNMSSIARHGNRGQSNYSAAKAALAANTWTWAREFAPFGIRVGAIAPGMIETPMTQGMNQKARDALVANIPVARIGVPEDIWLGVKFVIECDYFNGRTIDIDGGLVM
jgi:3-oxoacyl-[acyl-carrier protein] reductase